MSMACTECGSLKTIVNDSRSNEKRDAVRRRRKCLACGYRFSTYEVDSRIFADAIKTRAAVIEQLEAVVPDANPMRFRPQRRSS